MSVVGIMCHIVTDTTCLSLLCVLLIFPTLLTLYTSYSLSLCDLHYLPVATLDHSKNRPSKCQANS